MDEAPAALEPRQEIRFAVVMYGGVSLAIYMNGVAQEMLRLVRATSAAVRGGPARRCEGTELVYRKLGRMLRRGEKPLRKSQAEGARPRPVATRFVIDVISGTSAGGINGVFLAKALANDQGLDDLKNLWVEEGDFGKLMNDRWSLPGVAPRTRSLLDGKRMYRELLKALEGMDRGGDGGAGERAAPPLVEELDLFVTATDISGLTLPLQFADGVVQERRHRNTFHFVYSTTPDESGQAPNDFARHFNPFLAFAARCTSSFPVAFEPMKLADIDDVVPTVEPYAGKSRTELRDCLSTSKHWRRFFQDYLKAADGPAAEIKAARAFARRSFGDGGYLDNKPFSYAIDTLLRRRADLPVDRKLVFVDPDPQNPEADPDFDRDVDLMENTLSALAPTVSTETIREDIQRVLERNRLIERIDHATRHVEGDINKWIEIVNETRADAGGVAAAGTPQAGKTPLEDQKRPAEGVDWAQWDLKDMFRRKGLAYGGYHRLKVASVTNDLTEIFVSAANFQSDSDHFLASRYFFEAWRDLKYGEYRGQKPETQFRFLSDFDFEYRLRRIRFMRSKINELTALGAEKLLEKLEGRGGAPRPGSGPDSAAVFKRYFHQSMGEIQKALSPVHDTLLTFRSRCRQPGKNNWLHETVLETGLTADDLDGILKLPADEERAAAAREHFREKPDSLAAFDRLAEQLGAGFKPLFKQASDRCKSLFTPERLDSTTRGVSVAYGLIWHYFQRFEDYDMVIFPVTFQTEVGEMVPVDVIRVSPYDADSLIDERESERRARAGGAARRKLGGRELGHFGAFFERTWRKNDIMWGRLDAAERLINTLLPDTGDEETDKGLREDRGALIKEAHMEILKEELLASRDTVDAVRRRFARSLLAAGSRQKKRPAIRAVNKQLRTSPPSNAALNSILDSCVEPDKLLNYLKGRDEREREVGGYEVDRRLDPEVLVPLLARATKVFGRMLEALAERHRMDKRRVVWVTRLGQVFWALVEVAVPGSFWNLLFRHFVKLLYFFEAVLIVGGLLLSDDAMQKFGLMAFAITAATYTAVKLLGDYMRGRRFFASVLVCGALVIEGLVVWAAYYGFAKVLEVLGDGRDWFLGLGPVKEFAAWGPFVWVVAKVASFPPGWRALAIIGAAAALLAVVSLVFDGVRLTLQGVGRAVRRLAVRAAGLTARAWSGAAGLKTRLLG